LDRWGCACKISSRLVKGFGFPLALHIPTDKQTSVRPFIYIERLFSLHVHINIGTKFIFCWKSTDVATFYENHYVLDQDRLTKNAFLDERIWENIKKETQGYLTFSALTCWISCLHSVQRSVIAIQPKRISHGSKCPAF